jgi:23S rRNA pseudouridine1911/1915/1917 synthase
MNLKDWILYEDDAFIAVNKPALLPTQPDLTGAVSLLDFLDAHLDKKSYLLHRIDRPTSGVVLFAKNEIAAAHLNQQFQNRETQKLYLAVVEKPAVSEQSASKPLNQGDLVHYLIENKEKNRSYITEPTRKDAKRAELSFILRGVSDRYNLLEITLKTGRHHQIRAQLSAIGCPIKGDVKYGARRRNADRSIHLHAWKLTFFHPFLNKKIDLIAKLPNDILWQFFDEMITTGS